MRTFAELLTEYMARTGISDSELARTLGVRRQTIFRWKEGLVEKPRNREDILRVADRLRLAPEERDGLLLAAGFPPEAPPPSLSAVPTEYPAELRPPVLPTEPTESVPATAPTRTVPKAAWLAVPVLALLIIAVLLVIRLPSGPAYPLAAPGESLVLIAPLDSSAAPTESPSRRTPSESATPATYGFSERLRTALEREIQAARFERVRVAIAPEKIPDVTAAETARRRANARLVIWGNDEGGALLARFAPAPAASRTDDLPLDALVTAPTDLPLRIDMAAPEQVQALALFALSQAYFDQGEMAQARAALTHLPQAQPAWFAQMGYIYQLSEPPDLGQATQFYSQTIDLDSNAATAFLNRGVSYIRQNKPVQWQADLNRVLALQPDDVFAQEALCWGYALNGQPDVALPHCDAAVRLGSTARSRDARAIAYAEAGRLTDAANDWQAFLEWLTQQPESLRARYGSTRADWLQAVQAGRNPIDTSTLDRLRLQ